MLTTRYKPLFALTVSLLTFLLIFVASVLPAGAAPPEPICFDLVAILGGAPGSWSSSGLVTSGGTAIFDPFVAGWDPELGIPATVHHEDVLTDEHGSITYRAQAKSALVTDDDGDPVPGYHVNWVIISGTGAYATLRGQGDGYGWPDFASGTFPAYLCGQAHFHPHK